MPDYLPALSRDPRHHDHPMEQYLYRSDGKEFKFISHAPDGFVLVTARKPALADLVRPGWAYGFWTPGAAGW